MQSVLIKIITSVFILKIAKLGHIADIEFVFAVFTVALYVLCKHTTVDDTLSGYMINPPSNMNFSRKTIFGLCDDPHHGRLPPQMPFT